MGAKGSYFVYPFSSNPAFREILQPWGPTSNTAEPAAHGYPNWHLGVDFNVPQDTPIEAAAAGTIIHAGPDVSGGANGGYGICVAIDHGDSFYTLYGHLDSLYTGITLSVHVNQGNIIGFSDSTGNSSGPHLHFGVFRTPAVFGLTGDVNPMDYIADTPDTSALPGSGAGDTISPDMAVYLARHAGIPDGQLATAVAIAMAESGLQVSAQNASGAAGLWQILPSAHPNYDVSRLKSDPQYNANAMADISTKGTHWGPWETYTTGAYTTYLAAAAQAVKETPASTSLADLDTAQSGTGSYVSPDAAANVVLPPPPPPDPFSVVQVNVDPQALLPTTGTLPTAYLWINGVFLPVVSCDFTQPAYRNPGQFNAVLSTLSLETDQGQQVMDAFFTRAFTQVVIYLGYVQDTRHYNPALLKPAFTGIVTPPRFDYGTYEVTLSGPDLSGIFSDPSATAVDPGNLGSYPSDQAIEAIINGHKGRGVTGISFAHDPVAGLVGGIFGQGTPVVTRGTGQTEWDTMVTISAGEGCALWFSGTTLNMKRVPPSLPPQVLPYGESKPPSLLKPPVFMPQPHAKRTYYVAAQSYDTGSGQIIEQDAGNSDTTSVITLTYQPNVPPDRLQKFATDALAAYEATEVQADIETNGIVPLAFGQPLVIDSDEIDPRFCGRAHPYYPASTTYRYDQNAGISMTIKATNRALGIQTAQTPSSLGV